ncbi:MAG TPA: polysaccharide biosynthesis/export family protein [Bryobacteraceae bacterium]
MRRKLTLLVFVCGGVWAQNNSVNSSDSGPPKVEAPKITPGAPDPNTTGVPVDPKAYLIGELDEIYVKVFRDTDFTGMYLVQPGDGKITLPLIGEMQAAGLTPEALGVKIQEALSESVFSVKPDVKVMLAAVNSKWYTVTGEVNRPGRYPLLTETHVFEAINETGGFKDFANKKKIVIARGQKRLKFNYEDVRKGKNLDQNIALENGDTIIIQ